MRLILTFCLFLFALPAMAAPPMASRTHIEAHERFLAGEALQGRQSASRDEFIAASYIESQFRQYGLTPVPGMDGFIQKAQVLAPKLDGKTTLTAANGTFHEKQDFYLISANTSGVSGVGVVVNNPETAVEATIWLVDPTSKASVRDWRRAGQAKGVKLIVFTMTEALEKIVNAPDFETYVPATLVDSDEAPRPTLLVAKPEVYTSLAKGGDIGLNINNLNPNPQTTYNVIGYLKGTDETAGMIMISAHFDHFGQVKKGDTMVTYYGANDDASGTVAVLELARIMASGKPPKRSIVFVCYGSEELGLLGSRYFVSHPPFDLNQLVANIEFEMIGQQDPNLPKGVMMMTGFDRSTLGPSMVAKGAHITADPYPEQHFFERSDNFALAQKGIVAHTISGWATTPTYHSPEDDIAHIDFEFMTSAIQSLVLPVQTLANSKDKPQWVEGKKP